VTEANKIQVKVYAAKAPATNLFVPVFHRWIREKALDELAIDVADYEHVHQGPGVVLVGNAFDYYWDLGEGRPGLIYSRKREVPSPEARLTDAVRRALVGCRILEQEATLSGIAFRTDELLVRLPDRLNAPATEEGYAAFQAELGAVAAKLFSGAKVTLDRFGGARDMLGARVKASASGTVAELLARVS
jgi:hypothetical protein